MYQGIIYSDPKEISFPGSVLSWHSYLLKGTYLWRYIYKVHSNFLNQSQKIGFQESAGRGNNFLFLHFPN